MIDFSAHGTTGRDWVIILSGCSFILVAFAASTLLLALRRRAWMAGGTALAGLAVLVIPLVAVYNQVRPRRPDEYFEAAFELWFVWAVAAAVMLLLSAMVLVPMGFATSGETSSGRE